MQNASLAENRDQRSLTRRSAKSESSERTNADALTTENINAGARDVGPVDVHVMNIADYIRADRCLSAKAKRLLLCTEFLDAVFL